MVSILIQCQVCGTTYPLHWEAHNLVGCKAQCDNIYQYVHGCFLTFERAFHRYPERDEVDGLLFKTPFRLEEYKYFNSAGIEDLMDEPERVDIEDEPCSCDCCKEFGSHPVGPGRLFELCSYYPKCEVCESPLSPVDTYEWTDENANKVVNFCCGKCFDFLEKAEVLSGKLINGVIDGSISRARFSCIESIINAGSKVE